MTSKAIDKSAKSDRSAVARPAAGSKVASTLAPAANTTGPHKREATPVQHPVNSPVTKHAQLLQLLNRPEGASIEDMMQATEWQQHSVRGFLAGTVKKKMGLALTSSKAEGDVRRYRIASSQRRAFSATRRGS
ncbi:MAG: hypothetical protein CTY20_14620 [Hyphomicrobium sp.]|nr:DUF3489 domain-containing protein [Hyphomicrobium sp.]PPD26276.1 MAG: hypothetical protein CTY20_14620 [Hyphomicrobium sp.]